jgi:diguanylate cyclase (GGDEF)-like protein
LDERAVLGSALLDRSDDVLRLCQKEFSAHFPTVPSDVVLADPRWELNSLAVHIIGNWLLTSASANSHDRMKLASLGNSVAKNLDILPPGPSTKGTPGTVSAKVSGQDPLAIAFDGSIAMVTRLNLWWSDATRAVLTEEAARLHISKSTLDEACDMVLKSCNASLVQMGKQYDEELASLHERLSHLALHDTLTGLVNRTVLVDRLNRAIARLARHPGGLALIFMDLDDFKEVNDVHGHASGDELLVELSARLMAQFRPEDVVARFGGDEFVALAEDLNDPPNAARALTERLRAAIAKPVTINGQAVSTTMSIGVAVVQTSECTSDGVLAEADAAMYSAKRSGNNQVVLVDCSVGSGNDMVGMASALRRALEVNEFRLDYQATYAAEDQAFLGFEALLRWEHPERGDIAPLEFIRVAEESGLMGAIGSWVITEACRQAVAWGAEFGVVPRMAVNVSIKQLTDPHFVDQIAAVLVETGMTPDRLVLEIAEDILLTRQSHCETVLTALKDLGVQLAIDDFGSTCTSLSYLRQLPFDQLKVDRAFVADMAIHGDDRIMQAMVRLAHDLGLEVIAERVETVAEFDIVRSLGCDAVQGFLLGRPVGLGEGGPEFGQGPLPSAVDRTDTE